MSGPYVFCNGFYPAFGTCVDGNPHGFYIVEAQSTWNYYYQVCATQKWGPYVGAPLQYSYVCGSGTPGIYNFNGFVGNATAHNHEPFGQGVQGLFYLP